MSLFVPPRRPRRPATPETLATGAPRSLRHGNPQPPETAPQITDDTLVADELEAHPTLRNRPVVADGFARLMAIHDAKDGTDE